MLLLPFVLCRSGRFVVLIRLVPVGVLACCRYPIYGGMEVRILQIKFPCPGCQSRAWHGQKALAAS